MTMVLVSEKDATECTYVETEELLKITKAPMKL